MAFSGEGVSIELERGTTGSSGQDRVTPNAVVLEVSADLGGARCHVVEKHVELRSHEERRHGRRLKAYKTSYNIPVVIEDSHCDALT